MKKHHAYTIRWRDSCAFGGWQQSNSPDHCVSVITSVGWLVRKTAKEITITTSVSEHGNVMDAVTIPREAVVRMTKLKMGN